MEAVRIQSQLGIAEWVQCEDCDKWRKVRQPALLEHRGSQAANPHGKGEG
jgi:hypothetical protein